MYKIIDKTGTGKTGRLLLLAKETGATVACKDPKALIVKADSYGIKGINIIEYSDLLDNPQKYGNILIDDLEEFASYAVSFTVSGEDRRACLYDTNNGLPSLFDTTNRLVGYTMSED